MKRKLINWTKFSNTSCKNIKHEYNDDENNLHMYTAFITNINDIRCIIVYKNNIVHMGYNYNEMVNFFYGMKLLLEHIKEKELINSNQKLYTIVQHDYINGGYLSHSVDGLIFKSEDIAEEYRKIKPDYDSTSVEELILYPDK